MKKKLWLAQSFLILAFSALFWVSELSTQGALQNAFLRERLAPPLKRVLGVWTDLKFRFRGAQKPKSPITIVEIDSESLEAYGRWPWHRDRTAKLVQRILDEGAKVVGLDMVFSERDERISRELSLALKDRVSPSFLSRFETDGELTRVLRHSQGRVVLGWTSESICQPLHASFEECPVTHAQALASHPEGWDRFAVAGSHLPERAEPQKSPFFSFVTVLSNLPEFNEAARFGGFFNAFLDPDGAIREASLVLMGRAQLYPSLALEMARAGQGEEISIQWDQNQRIRALGFSKSKKEIPISPLGVMGINFRGPARTFPYLSAAALLNDAALSLEQKNQLKGAYVLIGLSALGVFDMRSFPFDSNMPGVEGHAAILDNLLAGDPMVTSAGSEGRALIFGFMSLGVFCLGFLFQRLEAIPSLFIFLGSVFAIWAIDFHFLFSRRLNFNLAFLELEVFSVFLMTLTAKYVLEERNKKFIRGAFSKYVAPTVVDAILKDPKKLSLGGEKREVSILFSDIRGFTQFSENMDAQALSQFLNDYLGIMTDIVFAHEGTLDKYIGDAVMAFWGAPLNQPDHALKTCRAAVAMLQALSQHRERFKSRYGVHVDIGVGINTGIVNVGNMGSERNFEYTVIGDHVNLASRLEGLTKSYSASILTTRFTLESMGSQNYSHLSHRVLDEVKVKGKKKAVELIQVLDREVSKEGLELFERGRSLYLERDWGGAMQCFQRSSELLAPSVNHPDGPSENYLQRCRDFLKNPPQADWDGSWEMLSK